jgi:ABC-type lipoprotein release transport system permease subunit
VLADSYKQASLFFDSTKEAHRVAELLNAEDFIAVPADTTYTETAEDAVLLLLESAITALLWLLAVIFLAFFINLCSLRAVESFKGDIAIMRSMGIKVDAIKMAIYARMTFCLIPAFLLLGLLSASIYTSVFNEFFTYLYGWQYAAILLGMVILTVRTTRKQIRRLFSDSVKKTIKGGEGV